MCRAERRIGDAVSENGDGGWLIPEHCDPGCDGDGELKCAPPKLIPKAREIGVGAQSGERGACDVPEAHAPQALSALHARMRRPQTERRWGRDHPP